MLVQAILIGLIAMFVTFEWMFGTNLGSRPIITGMLVGLVMGDLKTGIILGCKLLRWYLLVLLHLEQQFHQT